MRHVRDLLLAVIKLALLQSVLAAELRAIEILCDRQRGRLLSKTVRESGSPTVMNERSVVKQIGKYPLDGSTAVWYILAHEQEQSKQPD